MSVKKRAFKKKDILTCNAPQDRRRESKTHPSASTGPQGRSTAVLGLANQRLGGS